MYTNCILLVSDEQWDRSNHWASETQMESEGYRSMPTRSIRKIHNLIASLHEQRRDILGIKSQKLTVICIMETHRSMRWKIFPGQNSLSNSDIGWTGISVWSPWKTCSSVNNGRNDSSETKLTTNLKKKKEKKRTKLRRVAVVIIFPILMSQIVCDLHVILLIYFSGVLSFSSRRVQIMYERSFLKFTSTSLRGRDSLVTGGQRRIKIVMGLGRAHWNRPITSSCFFFFSSCSLLTPYLTELQL